MIAIYALMFEKIGKVKIFRVDEQKAELMEVLPKDSKLIQYSKDRKILWDKLIEYIKTRDYYTRKNIICCLSQSTIDILLGKDLLSDKELADKLLKRWLRGEQHVSGN